MPKTYLIQALLFLFLTARAQENSSSIELFLSESYTSSLSPEGNLSFDLYKFLLPAEITYPDLMILVVPSTKNSEPTISFSQDIASLTSGHFECYSFDLGVCTVFMSTLTLNSPLYINVSCSEDCRYSIRLEPSYLNETINLNQSLMLRFKGTTSHLLNFYLDELDEDAHVLITANPMNPGNLYETFHFYVKKGQLSPSSLDFDYYPHPIWKEGKGVSISSKSPSVESAANSNYTILIEALEGIVILLTAKRMENIRDLDLGEDIKDIIESGELQFFKLELSNEAIERLQERNLLFKVKSYSGKPSMFIHFDTKPGNLSHWRWNTLEIESQGITITKSELDSLRATGACFYIALKGVSAGGYLLQASIPSYNFTDIDFYQTLSGKLLEAETENYRFVVKKTEKVPIIVETKAWTGAVNVFLKLCCGKIDCVVTSPSNCFVSSRNQEKIKKLRFRYAGYECEGYHGSNIYYGVMVEGQSIQKAKYAITIKREKKSQVLEENVIIRETLNIGETAYFSFLLGSMNAGKLKTLHFQVNMISGDGTVYFSNSSQYPNSTSSSFISDRQEFVDVSFKKPGVLSGNYYLAVEATTLLDFTVLVLTEKGESEPVYWKLIEAQPAKFQFEHQDQKFYFQVESPSNCQKIYFDLQPIWGFFVVYVLEIRNDTLAAVPSKSLSDYSFSGEEGLSLKVDSTVLYYRILVVLDDSVNDESGLSSSLKYQAYQFSLLFVGCQSLETLTFGAVKHIKIFENEKKFFRVRYSSEEDFISIIARTDVSPKIFYIWGSYSEQNQFPSFAIHDFQLNSSVFNLTLQKEELLTSCAELTPNETLPENVSSHCSLYLAAESPLEELAFTLLVRRDFSPIKLIEGTIISMPPLNANESLQFFFHVNKRSPISVFFTSQAESYILYGLVSKLFTRYPAKNAFEYVSYGSNQLFTELIIPESRLEEKKCFELTKPCYLLMTLQCVIKTNLPIRFSASSSLIPLDEGHPIMSSVEAGMFKYFSLQITNRNAESFVVSVSPVGEGDPDLFISKGQNSLPTLLKFDWRVQSMKSDYIRLTRDDTNGSLKGAYNIGVYGFSACSFILNALISKNVQALTPGIMLKLEIADSQFLEYFHWGNDSFRLTMVNVDSRAVLYGSKYVNKEREFISSFPSEESHIWVSNTKDNSLSVQGDDPRFCRDCQYLFTVDSLGVTTTVTLLLQKQGVYNEMKNGEDFKDQVRKDGSNLYSFRTVTGFMEMSLRLLSGEVQVYIGEHPFYDVSKAEWLFNYTRKNFLGNNLDVRLGEAESLVDYQANYSTVNSSKTFYVMVVGESNSTYVLRFTSRNKWKILRFGVTDYSVLGPNETQNYEFSAMQNEDPFTVLVTFPQKKDHGHEDLVDFNLMGIRFDIEKGFEEFPVNITSKSVRKGSILLKFPFVSSQYHFNLSNNGLENHTVRYALLINTREAEILDSGAEGKAMFLEINSSHTYELFSPGELTLFIEVIECYGKVELRGTQDYLKSQKADFDWEFFYPNGNSHILARYDVANGPVFLRVGSMEMLELDTMYFMRTFLVSRDEKMPQELYLPGNDGVFLWRIVEETNNRTMDNKSFLIVDFQTVECEVNCLHLISDYQVIAFSYTLHVTKEDRLLKTMARCDVAPKEGEYYKTLRRDYEANGQPKTDSFRFTLEGDGTYFINVVGEVWAFNEQANDYQSFKVLYRQQEVLLQKTHQQISLINNLKQNRNWQIIALAAGLVGILSIVGCCYYKRRGKKLQKKVYELGQAKAAEGDVFDEQGTADLKGENKLFTAEIRS